MSNDPSQDQDFLNAAPHEQHAYLMATDADYAKASPQDQVAYLSHVSPKLSQTQFEKDRPGHGITMEGMGTAALGSVKKLGTGLLGMLDPTQGLSGAGLTSIGLNPRSGSVDDRLGEVPIVNAVKEAKAGWQRGDNYPGGRTGEATASALGSFVGESGQGAAEHAARGEGGAILGEAAVPAAVAIGAPLMRPIGRVARNRVADALIEPGGKPKPGARLALGSDRARALGEILKPEDAAYERKAQDLMRRGKEQDALDRKAARDAKANAPKPSPFAGATSSGESVGTPIELPAPREQAPMPVVRSKAEVAAANTPKPSIVTPESGPRIESEGRPATWTNEKVLELAAKGNRAAIAQAGVRQLPMPPNARYVAGDPDYRNLITSPREVTKFGPTGEPIRQEAKQPLGRTADSVATASRAAKPTAQEPQRTGLNFEQSIAVPSERPIPPPEEAVGNVIPPSTPGAVSRSTVEEPIGLRPGLTSQVERRSSVRDVQGPDLMRTARAQQLRAQLEDPSLSTRDRAIIEAQLEDLKANPFERHEGGDINSMKANKTVSREEAQRNTEKRKEGRNKRFAQ